MRGDMRDEGEGKAKAEDEEAALDADMDDSNDAQLLVIVGEG